VVFLQKYHGMGFSGFYGIFLLKKNHRIGPRDHRPGAQHLSVGAVHSLLNLDQRWSSPCRSAAQIRGRRGLGPSNLDHSSRI
jgi:hypothetical protein